MCDPAQYLARERGTRSESLRQQTRGTPQGPCPHGGHGLTSGTNDAVGERKLSCSKSSPEDDGVEFALNSCAVSDPTVSYF